MYWSYRLYCLGVSQHFEPEIEAGGVGVLGFGHKQNNAMYTQVFIPFNVPCCTVHQCGHCCKFNERYWGLGFLYHLYHCDKMHWFNRWKTNTPLWLFYVFLYGFFRKFFDTERKDFCRDSFFQPYRPPLSSMNTGLHEYSWSVKLSPDSWSMTPWSYRWVAALTRCEATLSHWFHMLMWCRSIHWGPVMAHLLQPELMDAGYRWLLCLCVFMGVYHRVLVLFQRSARFWFYWRGVTEAFTKVVSYVQPSGSWACVWVC